jgi:DNA-binding winged helix-turn-helix (wHTH) protein
MAALLFEDAAPFVAYAIISVAATPPDVVANPWEIGGLSVGTAMRVRFGDCVLDTDTRELSRAGEPLRVPPKVFRLLELLLERRPKAVSKEQLHELLWPRTFVTDAALTSVVKEARAAIGDDARKPRFIRTVSGFGYAFTVDVRPGSGSSRPGLTYRIAGQGAEVNLAEGENILGRGSESVLWIDHETVSRRHARIRVEGGRAMLEDLGSKNGTFLRGERIDGPVELLDGDEFGLGEVALRFRRYETPASTRSAAGHGQPDGREP